MAGLRERANIYRIKYDDDDVVGGAVPEEFLAYSSIMTELDAKMPTQVFLEQGLETQKVFTAIVIPSTLEIYERDEYEPVFPYNHPFINKRFRIVGVVHSSNLPFDPKSYIILSMVRSVKAHEQQ